MINKSLEEHLRLYCVKVLANEDVNQLFETQLYQPLRFLASSILSKSTIPQKEFTDDLINNMVAECSIKLPECFDATRGTAKIMSYIIMSQYISHIFKFNNNGKRNNSRTVYLEDIKNIDSPDICRVIKVEVDVLTNMKELLTEHKHIFDKLNCILHRVIAYNIIDCIDNPNNYVCEFNSYVKSIAKKSKASPVVVRTVIRKMSEMMELIEG